MTKPKAKPAPKAANTNTSSDTGRRARAGNNSERARALYTAMVRIRAFEETAVAAHKVGEIPGPLHVSIGQEGVAAGVCLALERQDRITSNHRGHGHALAKGADAQRMFLELFGREGGFCGGKGGSMHIADFSVGMLGANGVVSGGIPIAVGAAQGLKMLGEKNIAVCFFGDGAINRGPFLEGLNWAALYKLPVLFVCEDNGVAAFTAAASVTAGPGVMARSEALGVPAVSVDGNDAEAVLAATEKLVAEIKGGAGPRLLHAVTYRWSGHTSTDAAAWRDPAEVEAWKARCPIERLAKRLAANGLGDELVALNAAAAAEMALCRKTALAAPWPAFESAYADV